MNIILKIPKKYQMLRADIGIDSTPESIMECWNDCFQGIADELVSFDGKNFIDSQNEVITKKDVYFQLNDYLKDN